MVQPLGEEVTAAITHLFKHTGLLRAGVTVGSKMAKPQTIGA